MEKTGEEQIKIDRLYEKDLSFNEIIKNPILQPIAEASAIYESQGLIIQRALFEFTRTQEQITNLMKENPTYQQTILMSKVRDILNYSQQVIHSQDIQRESIKRCINDIVRIIEKNYEYKNLSFPPNLEMAGMNKFIQAKIENKFFSEEDAKEVEEQKQEKMKLKKQIKMIKDAGNELQGTVVGKGRLHTKEELEDDEELIGTEKPKIKKLKKVNPWFKHVEEFKKEHPEFSPRQAMTEAKKTYIPLEKEITKSNKKRGRPPKLKNENQTN